MRNLAKVIKEMLVHIPEDDYLHEELKNHLTSVEFSSPETMSFRWELVLESLYERFGNNKPESNTWMEKVLKIWNPRYEEDSTTSESTDSQEETSTT